MNLARCALLVLCAWLFGAMSQATPPPIPHADFVQRLGQQLPLDASFLDETGRPVRLGSFFTTRPVLLVMAYYECPNLCTVVLNGLLGGVRNLRSEAGRGFEIVVISINPEETPALAAEKKRVYTLRYGRPGAQLGWHFLVGQAAQIARVSAAIGFHFEFDPVSRQYAHPSGLVVVAPNGIVSRYFLGIEFPAPDLHAAIADALDRKISAPSSSIFLFCFHYDPQTGRYSLIITRALQIACFGTVLALVALVWWLSRRRRRTLQPSAWAAIFPFFHDGASNFANSVDAIFYALLLLCGLIVLGIFVAALYFCVRYRAGARASLPATKRSPLKLEAAWTGATFITFLGIFVWSAVVYLRMAQPPAGATEIQVVARQWMWKAQHAGGRREINELHLVLNQPVKLLMTSQDVIHDFYIPAFRTKQDVLPGRYTSEWFTPTRPGKYHLFCAEYCGTDHSQMGGWIYVLEPAEYARWLAGQPAGESIVMTGARLFVARGCSGCHAANATVHAPPLEGLYGKPVPLADGTFALADDQYLRDSILLPNKQIAAGYAAVMPTFTGQLSEEDVFALVTYLKSLRQEGTP